MRTTSRTRIGRGGIAVLLLMMTLVMQGSVRADATISPRDERALNRAIISLLQGGKNISAVFDWANTFAACFNGVDSACAATEKAGEKVGIRSDFIYRDFELLAGLTTSRWSVYEGFTGTTGRMTIMPGSTPGESLGSAQFFPSGSAYFSFTLDDNGDYDFKYSNSLGDAGKGYLVWAPNGCALVGIFVSEHLKDKNGNFNSAIFVLRRC